MVKWQGLHTRVEVAEDRTGAVMSLLKKRSESRSPVPASALPYWTVRVKVAECVMLPLVAVTVTTELPAGVPGS